MNKIIYTFLIFGALLNLNSSFIAADCDDEDFLDDCAAQIAGYRFVKANKITVKGGKSGQNVELSNVFSKGSTYILTACAGGSSNMIVSLYDRNKRKIMSNFDSKTKKFYSTITYKCTATGVYYFKYEFQGGGEGCGVGIIGFKQ